jgi:hypothetical protein
MRSHCRGCIPPSLRRLGSEVPERRPRIEMTLKAEIIVDGGMHAEEGAGRIELI